MTVERHEREQRLRRGHYAPNCVHRELLYHAIDRCRERLELGSSLGLDHVLSKAGGLLLGLGQLLKAGAAVLGGGGSALSLLLRHLAIERSELGLLFGRLTDQELAVHLDQRRAGALGRAEVLKWIGAPVECCAQSRDIEAGGDKVALEMIDFGLGHGRIKLDEDFAGLDALPVTDVDRANDACLERLDHLGAPAWNDLARRSGDDVDGPKRGPNQRQTEQSDDRGPDCAPGRRRWRLDDLERSGQEGEFLLAAPNLLFRKWNNLLSGCHGFPPADSAASRSGRCYGSAHHGYRLRRCGRVR